MKFNNFYLASKITYDGCSLHAEMKLGSVKHCSGNQYWNGV